MDMDTRAFKTIEVFELATGVLFSSQNKARLQIAIIDELESVRADTIDDCTDVVIVKSLSAENMKRVTDLLREIKEAKV